MSRAGVSHRPHGAREWLTERIALAILAPLGVWLAVSGYSLAGEGYDAALAWASSPLNAVLLAVTAVLFCLYAAIAWKVIIEDYLRGPAKPVAMAANYVFFVALAAAALYFIFSLAGA